MGYIDLVHILHQVDGRLSADMLIQRSSECIGDIIFSIGKCTCSAESAHDRTSLASDTALHLVPVDRTTALLKWITRFKHCDLEIRILFHQFIRRKNPARSGSDNNHVILHLLFLPIRFDIFPKRTRNLILL